MSRTAITVGPHDQGRRMTLEEFENAEGLEGRLYELGRGVITVTDVPKPRHFVQVNAVRRQLSAYDLAHPGKIYGIATGSECKILLGKLQSERHPDLALYQTPPTLEEHEVWSTWVPEIVIEVVSPSSRDRDYGEKREEYLAFGVLEYWVVDADERRMIVHRRSRGNWSEPAIEPPGTYRTRLLPGLVLETVPIFLAADEAGGD
jgi:Uma2 family endonuclease